MKKYIATFDKIRMVSTEVTAKNKKEAEEKALAKVQKRDDGGSGFTLFDIQTL